MIRKLLSIERTKLLNYNPFRITLGLWLLAFALGLIIYPSVDKEIPVVSLSDVFRFPDVWMFLSWVTEPYNALLAMIIIMITTKEFNNHTFKTQIIFGLSRKDLLSQKILLITALSFFAALMIAISSLTLGLLYSYKLTLKIALENAWMIFPYFLSAFSYMSLGLLISLLIKNTAMALLSFLALRTFVDPVLWLILREHDIKWYLPFRTVSRLTPLPDLLELFQRKMNNSESIDESALEILPKGLHPGLNILLVVIYIILALYFSHRLFQRRRLA